MTQIPAHANDSRMTLRTRETAWVWFKMGQYFLPPFKRGHRWNVKSDETHRVTGLIAP